MLHVVNDANPEVSFGERFLSPEDRWSEVTAKISDYFAAGVDLVLVVDGKLQKVFAYRSLSQVRVFSVGENLEDPEILPGFRMALAELFE